MLPPNQVIKLKAEIEKAATLHLNAIDIDAALSHYTDDMVAISNTKVFSSREELAAELSGYYSILKRVNHASWEDINIQIISQNAATFTAKFNYGFTSKDGEHTDLKGVWTALFILDKGRWKIRLRHESFGEL
jgi:ketosteroid isomerase-like protein